MTAKYIKVFELFRPQTIFLRTVSFSLLKSDVHILDEKYDFLLAFWKNVLIAYVWLNEISEDNITERLFTPNLDLWWYMQFICKFLPLVFTFFEALSC